MKSGTFAQTLNPDPFGIPKYRSTILHSGRPSFSRHHFSSCLDGHSTATPPQLQRAGAAGSSPCPAPGIFLHALSLPCLLVPWNTVGKVRGQLCHFVTLANFYFIIILWLRFCDFSGCLTTLGIPFLTRQQTKQCPGIDLLHIFHIHFYIALTYFLLHYYKTIIIKLNNYYLIL